MKGGELIFMTDKAIAKKNELDVLSGNSSLAAMYQESSKLGAENLGGETPQLKIHSTGRSNRNQLANGAEPNDGYFFYKPTGEQFESVDCHILTISRGFRAPGLEEGKPDVFNQIVGGLIVDNGEFKPFVMYFTGLKLSYLWDFGKDAAKYTRAKPISIPMFALTVRLTTEKIANNFGKSWIIKFEILKNEDGSPKLVLDEGMFVFLKQSYESAEDMVSALVTAKEVATEDPAIQGQSTIIADDEKIDQAAAEMDEDPGAAISQDELIKPQDEVGDLEDLPF